MSGDLTHSRWDIFCRVVDNYGDVGVCWRLARQLAAEYGLRVRLWVDDLSSLQRLCHAVDVALEYQTASGVEIRRWGQTFPQVAPADVVIEAFACEIPQRYLAAMVECKPLWINLEYLTAEAWAADCHAAPSVHPTLALTKYFFFPGFTPQTGGLLREQHLAKGINASGLWQQLGVSPLPDDAIKISLFGYENTAVDGLLESWSLSLQPVICLLPEGRLLPQVAGWTGQGLQAGDVARRGNLTLHVLPFMEQDDYDRLLWACDCNFVRGEDSFVRAQWAAKPLVWHIYQQQDNAHQAKLDAFLQRYCQQLRSDVAQDFQQFWQQWNAGQPVDWASFWRHRAALQQHAKAWAQQQSSLPDLATLLVKFHKNRI